MADSEPARPTIGVQRLNGDASWVLHTTGLRVLWDPWLVGDQVNGAAWFNREWHVDPVVELDEVPRPDVIVISQRYADHCHLPTLARLPEVPLLAVPPVVSRLRRAFPAREVHALPRWGTAPLRVAQATWGWVAPTVQVPRFFGVVVQTAVGRFVHAPHSLPASLAPVIGPVTGLAITRVDYRLPWWLGGRILPGPAAADILVDALDPAWVLPLHEEDKRTEGVVRYVARRWATPLTDARRPERWLELTHRAVHAIECERA